MIVIQGASLVTTNSTLGDGNDTLVVDGALVVNDILMGGGDDIVVVKAASNLGQFKLSTEEGDDTVYFFGGDSIGGGSFNLGEGDDVFHLYRSMHSTNGVAGGAGDDTMTAYGDVLLGLGFSGGAGDDTLTGGDANDTLRGGSGDDVLVGGGGNDYIEGGSGDNTLTGGEGADRFSNVALFGGTHTITDFDASESDVLLMSGISITGTVTGSRTQYVQVGVDGVNTLVVEQELSGTNQGAEGTFTSVVYLQGVTSALGASSFVYTGGGSSILVSDGGTVNLLPSLDDGVYVYPGSNPVYRHDGEGLKIHLDLEPSYSGGNRRPFAQIEFAGAAGREFVVDAATEFYKASDASDIGTFEARLVRHERGTYGDRSSENAQLIVLDEMGSVDFNATSSAHRAVFDLGSSGSTIRTGSGNDLIYSEGDDLVDSRGGDDTIMVFRDGDGTAMVSGGAGDDTIYVLGDAEDGARFDGGDGR